MTGWSFLIVAAGRGKRFGGPPKLFEELGGLPLWAWSAGTAVKMKSAGVDRLILVAPPGMESSFHKEASTLQKEMEVEVVAGGESRRDSVLLGLKAAKGEMAMIHDAARPLSPRNCADGSWARLGGGPSHPCATGDGRVKSGQGWRYHGELAP